MPSCYALGRNAALVKFALASDELFRGSAEAHKKLAPIAEREITRLREAGIPELHQTGSSATGLMLPGDVSDLDLSVPHEGDPTALREALERSGVPFRRMAGNNAVHSYTTPEGTWVDVQVRPRKEVDYLRSGIERLKNLTEPERQNILLEKHKVHSSGDHDAYKKWKNEFYERYGVIPPGGDWSKVAAELRRSHAPRTGPDKLKIKTVDGTKVRDNIDTDFTMGGNPSRYSYIPKGEMWVENNLSNKDRVSTVIHEAIEHRLMKNKGMSYEKAHDEANKSDKKVRDIYEKVRNSRTPSLEKLSAHIKEAISTRALSRVEAAMRKMSPEAYGTLKKNPLFTEALGSLRPGTEEFQRTTRVIPDAAKRRYETIDELRDIFSPDLTRASYQMDKNRLLRLNRIRAPGKAKKDYVNRGLFVTKGDLDKAERTQLSGVHGVPKVFTLPRIENNEKMDFLLGGPGTPDKNIPSLNKLERAGLIINAEPDRVLSKNVASAPGTNPEQLMWKGAPSGDRYVFKKEKPYWFSGSPLIAAEYTHHSPRGQLRAYHVPENPVYTRMLETDTTTLSPDQIKEIVAQTPRFGYEGWDKYETVVPGQKITAPVATYRHLGRNRFARIGGADVLKEYGYEGSDALREG